MGKGLTKVIKSSENQERSEDKRQYTEALKFSEPDLGGLLFFSGKWKKVISRVRNGKGGLEL